MDSHEVCGGTPFVDLLLSLGANASQNKIRFHKPVLNQQVLGVRQPVKGIFTVANNHEVRFQVSSYDCSRELIIDPVLVYSSFLGGSSQQKCGPSSSSAAFVMKISADGHSLIYSTYLGSGPRAVSQGGSDSDFGTGIAVTPTTMRQTRDTSQRYIQETRLYPTVTLGKSPGSNQIVSLAVQKG